MHSCMDPMQVKMLMAYVRPVRSLNMPEADLQFFKKDDPLNLGAVEGCIGALTRQGRDGAILSTYREMIDKEKCRKNAEQKKATSAEGFALVQRAVEGIQNGNNIYAITPEVGGHIKIWPGRLIWASRPAWLNKGEGVHRRRQR